MPKQPRNPVARALRSPHLAQRRLPARPKHEPEDLDELLEDARAQALQDDFDERQG